MRASLLSYLACPQCQGALALCRQDSAEEVMQGELACAGCANRYPIENSIPRLMPRDLLDAQKSEMAARDAQVGDYDANRFLSLFGSVEVPMTLRRLGITKNDSFLEAGCGTGRMTQTFAGLAREVVAIDFSFQSLCVNAKKLRDAGVNNVHLLQADLCRLPFKDHVFDRGASCQVLEHVPTPDARQNAVRCLSRVLKPDSTLVISAYQHSVWTRQKQGLHDGGIPFFRFAKDEFSTLLSSRFRVESISGALVYLYLAKCKNAA